MCCVIYDSNDLRESTKRAGGRTRERRESVCGVECQIDRYYEYTNEYGRYADLVLLHYYSIAKI